MTALAATLLVLLTVSWGPGLRPVYAPHLRQHPSGPERRAEELAGQLRRAAHAARVELPLLVALAYHESALDHGARSRVGALGALQLLPSSPWGRGWLRACGKGPRAAEKGPRRRVEELNAHWGAIALRDGLRACRGAPGMAVGFYRTGRCVEGPKARNTIALARVVRVRLTSPKMGSAQP
jgi:hypothetical protein